MVERHETHPFPLAAQLPALRHRLDVRPRRPLPRALAALLSRRRPQIRHPGRRGAHHGLLARGLPRRRGIPRRAGFLPGHRLRRGEGRGRVWRIRVVRRHTLFVLGIAMARKWG